MTITEAEYDPIGRRWFYGRYVIKSLGSGLWFAWSNDWDLVKRTGHELGPFNSLEEATAAVDKAY